MIVVDANILAFYLLQGERTAAVQHLCEVDPEWAVPPLWRIEFQSILWKYVRHGAITDLAVDQLLQQAMEIFRPHEREPLAEMALRNALHWNISVYDAQYVTLAQQMGVRCVTEDRRLRNACPGLAISVEEACGGPSQEDRLVRDPKARYRAKNRKTHKMHHDSRSHSQTRR